MERLEARTRPIATTAALPHAAQVGPDDFIYRIDGFDLTPGWKSAGFFLTVSTVALHQLRAIEVSSEEQQALVDTVRERLSRASVLPKKAVKTCRLSFAGNSACPYVFITDPAFGASLGGDPGQLARLTDDDALEVLGATIDYTPHNCDAPAQAIALMIMVQTWAEWAYNRLLVHGLAQHG